MWWEAERRLHPPLEDSSHGLEAEADSHHPEDCLQGSRFEVASVARGPGAAHCAGATLLPIIASHGGMSELKASAQSNLLVT
eukprot:4722052-Amphidinium_carterae.3